MEQPFPQLALDEAPGSILILKPSSLGDIVHTLPAVSALKRRWPAASIRWLVNPEWAPLLEGNPALDETLLFPRQSFRGWAGPLRLFQWARAFGPTGKADLVLDFQCLLRSALVGRFCRRSRFYGLSDAREGARFFYDAAVRVDPGMHAVDRYLALARAVGAPSLSPLEWPLPVAALPEGFGVGTPFLAIHPFSRGKGKSLSLDQLRALCEALAPRRIVLVGRAQVEPEPLPHVENWLNRTTLLELTALLRAATWTLSVDSGPMHIAAALSPRVVAIHTWSDPNRVGPYPAGAWVWQRGTLFQRGHPEAALPVAEHAGLGDWLRNRPEWLQSHQA
jgi:ADP-heptose:LPS heptosyltransferase